LQFTSLVYLVFLAASVAVYFALPGPRTRTAWLLAASFLFYFSLSAGWTIALAAVVLIAYTDGLLIERASDEGRKRLAVRAGVVVIVGILAVFKYTAFAASLVNGGLAFAGIHASFPLVRLALPIGISFWTFQAVAYLIEVGRGDAAEHNLARYALFASFFPLVTAGPITRSRQLLPQLAEKHRFDYDGMRSALLLMTWGFIKKLLVADPLGVVVEAVYRNPHRFGAGSGGVLLVATLAFAVQIYCDFSGYTDIVRGSARLFGIELPLNFNRPYLSRSVKEFWRRWHMSLMSWLKDYVYIPLGGSRVSRVRHYANILAVFLISGLWHGAGMTFVVWGLLNGLYQVIGDITLPLRDRLLALVRVSREAWPLRVFQTLFTFALITVAWVFFRAQSLSDALYIVPRMLVPVGMRPAALLALGLHGKQLTVTLAAAVVVFAAEALSGRVSLLDLLRRQPLPVRWVVYAAGVLAVAVLGYYGPAYNASSFTYFRF
jgi:alginate O-acetyltransferase complex protein AlgI